MTEDRRTTVEELSSAGLAVAEAIRVAELAAIAVLALVIVPPLAILAVIVVVPMALMAALVTLIALPVLVVRGVHRHRAGHAHHQVRRLAELGRARAATATTRFHRAMALALAKLGAHGPVLGPPR